jgi:phospholipid transport system transporter-binding protein
MTGDLTLATVAKLFHELTPQVTGPDRCEAIDLGETGRIDSAGLALLLEWQALAHAAGFALRLENIPDDILRLARLCEAAQPLGLVDKALESPYVEGGA